MRNRAAASAPHAPRSTTSRCFAVIETELGWMGVVRSERGICATTLPRPTPFDALASLDLLPSDREMDAAEVAPLAEQIEAIVRGERVERPELDLRAGTPFQQAVWQAVLSIPFGETRSYGWIAAEIGRPLGAHAVGHAVSRNPLPLFVPCHRVVAADGSLGGYGAGVEALPTKRSLLRREGVKYEGPTLEMIRGA